jgi:hypothetical protein
MAAGESYWFLHELQEAVAVQGLLEGGVLLLLLLLLRVIGVCVLCADVSRLSATVSKVCFTSSHCCYPLLCKHSLLLGWVLQPMTRITRCSCTSS